MTLQTKPSVAAVILAAGGSRRLGRPKQLIPWDGRALLRKVVDEARVSRCDRLAVVVGASAAAIRPVLDDLPADTVVVLQNPMWNEGIASSIRCGVTWAARENRSAVLLAVGDQPALCTAHLDRLVEAHARGASLVASRYAGTLGVPALFARPYFGSLLALRGDEGARRILRHGDGVTAVDWEEGAFDVDVADDIARG